MPFRDQIAASAVYGKRLNCICTISLACTLLHIFVARPFKATM